MRFKWSLKERVPVKTDNPNKMKVKHVEITSGILPARIKDWTQAKPAATRAAKAADPNPDDTKTKWKTKWLNNYKKGKCFKLDFEHPFVHIPCGLVIVLEVVK